MKELWELQERIEHVRKKLNNAMKNGYEEETCYELSIELDSLIEEYISLDKVQ